MSDMNLDGLSAQEISNLILLKADQRNRIPAQALAKLNDAQDAMHRALDSLWAYIEAQETPCPTCAHPRYLHGDSVFGCLDCPIKRRWWGWGSVVEACTWKG